MYIYTILCIVYASKYIKYILHRLDILQLREEIASHYKTLRNTMP